jgi:hypothetical protein
LKVSLHIYPGRPVDSIINITKYLDSNDWYCVYLSDHFMHHKNHVKSGNMIECWTGLSFIASHTEKIQLSSFVSPISFRHPGILVNMATTVDEVSKGRLILGVGAGWQENEHLAYGFDILSKRERIDRFEEGIQCVNGLLNNNKFNFNGNFFNFNSAICEPKKYNRDIPIMIGCWSGNPRMVNYAIKYGDIINLIGGADQLKQKLPSSFNDSNIFKNVLSYPFIMDNFTKKIFEKYNSNQKKPYEFSKFTNYGLMSKKFLIEEIKKYKEMGFSEIIIGDMSFMSNEDLFFILDYIKDIIQNVD